MAVSIRPNRGPDAGDVMTLRLSGCALSWSRRAAGQTMGLDLLGDQVQVVEVVEVEGLEVQAGWPELGVPADLVETSLTVPASRLARRSVGVVADGGRAPLELRLVLADAERPARWR